MVFETIGVFILKASSMLALARRSLAYICLGECKTTRKIFDFKIEEIIKLAKILESKFFV